MTIRKPVSIIENFWSDAQRINHEDMILEQEHHDLSRAAIINNHFGSGALLSSPTKKVIFDSDFLPSDAAAILASGDFDGTGINIPDENQPTDINLGNQLEVELTGSELFGRESVKVLIVGLDFKGNIQYDRFYFHRNEIQVTAKHYTKILALFFNDFKGNNLCSKSSGDKSRIIIREASSFQLSRDSIMIAQDVEPNLFFRDFKIPISMGPNPSVELYNTLQAGIGNDYDVDALNISISPKRHAILDKNDVTTQIGQKFIALTNNIQKITLLLGVERDHFADVEHRYDWSGNLVVTLYKLQKTVSCQSEIVPNLAIEFDPDPEPIAQLSFTQQSLKDDYGIVLNDVLQPVDFVFSNTPAGLSGLNSVINPGDYYAVTIKRSGSASTGVLFTGVGNNRLENSVMTVYGNGTWVDIHEDDMWFQVWTNAAKVADGQGYDEGNGFIIDKTIVDENTGDTIDYSFGKKEFISSGELTVNNAILQVSKQGSHPIDDERTGNPVYSRQQYVPTFSFVNNSDLNELKNISEPFIIGSAWDTNPKSNPDLELLQKYPGLVKGNTFCIINPDADLLSLNLIGSRLIPNKNSDPEYRIFHVEHCTHFYGDVNGDGVIDNADIDLASNLIGEDISTSETQNKIINGDFTTLEFLRADVNGDGIISQEDVDSIIAFVNKTNNSFDAGTSFTSLTLKVQPSVGRWDSYYSCKNLIRLDDNNIVDPGDLTPEELVYYGYLPENINIEDDDITWKTTPFPEEGITYKIVASPFWKDYLVFVNSDVKYVPASFTYSEKINKLNENELNCRDINNKIPDANPGRNDFFIPDNLLIGNGQILNSDGTHHKIDFEVSKIILELPEIPLEEVTIDIFNKFVAAKEIGASITTAGYPAMKFADGSYVQTDALAKNQIKFGAALQAFVPNLDGKTDEDGYGIIVDDIIGIYLDDTNGLIKLNVKDLSMNELYRTLVTKIEITVYLKKGGWNNRTLVIPASSIEGLLE